MYNFKDVRDFAQQNAVSAAMSEMNSSGDIYAAAQSGALQADAEAITNVRYNDDGSLYVPPVGGVWLCGMAVGSRPVAVGESD